CDTASGGSEESKRYGTRDCQRACVKPIEIPSFIADVKDVAPKIKAAPGEPLTFKTDVLARPQDVTLLPFYKVFEPRYTVYWKVYTPAEWEKRKADLAAAESRRKMMERLTVDAVNINDQQSRRAHNLHGEGKME